MWPARGALLLSSRPHSPAGGGPAIVVLRVCVCGGGRAAEVPLCVCFDERWMEDEKTERKRRSRDGEGAGGWPRGEAGQSPSWASRALGARAWARSQRGLGPSLHRRLGHYPGCALGGVNAWHGPGRRQRGGRGREETPLSAGRAPNGGRAPAVVPSQGPAHVGPTSRGRGQGGRVRGDAPSLPPTGVQAGRTWAEEKGGERASADEFFLPLHTGGPGLGLLISQFAPVCQAARREPYARPPTPPTTPTSSVGHPPPLSAPWDAARGL